MPRVRKPAHIAMFSIAAHGHVNPSLDVIRELVARGHRVTYAIPPSFADVIASTGAEPKLWNSVLPTDDKPEEWGTELIDNMEPFLTDAVQALPQLTAAYEGDEPDLVLHDSTAFTAAVLARRWDVPAVLLSPHYVGWDGYEAEVGDAMMAELRSTERGRAFLSDFTHWLEGNGIGGFGNPLSAVSVPTRGLVLIPRVMQPNADRVDDSVWTFVGACQGDRAHQGEWRRPEGAADGVKVLLISLGSTFNHQPGFYRECVEAFGGRPDWHVVMQIGKRVDAAELGDIPANFEVSDWVPQLAVLRQADAFVTHAGMGGSQEGLAAGVPMVCVPQAADQFANADTLERIGVGKHLPMERATAQALREAVESLVNDERRAERSREIRREIEAEGGTRRAADLIEAELSG